MTDGKNIILWSFWLMIGNTAIMPVVKSLIHHHVIRKSWCPNPNKIAPPLPMFPSINHFTSYVPFSNNVFPLITPGSWRPIRSKRKILANLKNCLLMRLYFCCRWITSSVQGWEDALLRGHLKIQKKDLLQYQRISQIFKHLLQYQGNKKQAHFVNRL